MDRETLRALMQRVAAGEIDPADAVEQVSAEPFASLGFARVDHHRAIRDGFPEVVLAMGKTPSQTARIAREIVARSGRVLVTRVEPAHLGALRDAIPSIQHNADARLAWYAPEAAAPIGNVAVVSAGTADIPVAEEAAITAELAGARVHRIYDAGVAGIHRILAEVENLRRANALVVVAGMEGALPSVVGGLVANPVIAVPTSIGYGASFGGIAALLGMLNSCATGVCVVNIDNGFGAGYLAASINRLAAAGAAE
jgi:pyridinium-3,5-biscarboxylic acid mononucleotide synthase